MTLGDADFRKSPMKMIYRKVTKNSVITCHPPARFPILIVREVLFSGLVKDFRYRCHLPQEV
jgi:hypothetical protein